MHGLAHITAENKRRKDLAGMPTYAAASLLTLYYTDVSLLGALLLFVCIVMIYHHVYAYLFPNFETTHQARRLRAFFIGQLLFWAVVGALWFGARRLLA